MSKELSEIEAIGRQRQFADQFRAAIAMSDHEARQDFESRTRCQNIVGYMLPDQDLSVIDIESFWKNINQQPLRTDGIGSYFVTLDNMAVRGLALWRRK